jgi:hypothetical protein
VLPRTVLSGAEIPNHRQRALLPPRRQRPSHRAAKSRDLESTEERTEKWSGHGTLLILTGIAIEISMHLAHSSDILFSVLADACIGIGLIIEYFCIQVAIEVSRRQSVLRRLSDEKLIEALTRAARAETELVKFRAPRRSLMTAAAQERLIAQLTSFRGTEFDVGFGSGDGEQADTAWDIEGTLATAGWKQLGWGVHAVGIAVTKRSLRPDAGIVSAQNIEVQLDNAAPPSTRLAAKALVAALKDVGLEAREAPLSTPNTHENAVHILIGPKR